MQLREDAIVFANFAIKLIASCSHFIWYVSLVCIEYILSNSIWASRAIMAGGCLILVSGMESIHGSRLLYFPTHPWDSATVSIWSWMSETVRWKWKWKHPIETMTHPMRPTKYMKSDLPCGCSWALKTECWLTQT